MKWPKVCNTIVNVEELKSLGGLLKEKRREKNLSLKEVSDFLRLRSSLIEEIEKGEIPRNLAQVYYLGYLRQYARFLGCEKEADEVISKLKSQEMPTPCEKSEERERKGFRESKVLILLVIFSVFSLAVYSGIFKRISGYKLQSDKKETFSMDVASHVESVEKIEKKLLITCHERTWISVIIDGKEKKEFMLNPKDVIMINAREGFDLLIGNAGGIRIFLDGKEVEFSGRSGEVKRLRL